MTLESWDRSTGRYVFYRMAEEHSEDCKRFPFERIPKRVFLDTNVINVLVKYCEVIFDHSPIPQEVDATLAVDIEALMHVFYVGARADWDILGSRKTLDELSLTRDCSLRAELLEYAFGIVNQNLDDDDHRYAADFGRKLIEAPFVAALPDKADRELIGNAIGFGCDVFCTCDRATIVKKRDRLRQVPLRILTPEEWWAHVKPWAALWR
ncbi:hypothetical protein [Nitrospirillum viridazoti]|uniref:hypothetical protein n=1 Tax=Nitrospirillum viridazoti TaxID=3144925 RepID=UPI0011AB021A|nr:hypothetical protein [Nitrospirillum amazonense]TWB26701.1 hypothetical protein FBZ91_1384 [Nitrospirillum amazonense]